MKKIVPETLYEMRFVSAPSISPDGTMTAFVVSWADEEANGYKGDIWLAQEGAEPRPLTAGGDGRSFVWTERNTVLFPALRDGADKKRADAGEPLTVYYEIDPRGGEARRAFAIPEAVGAIRDIGGGKYLCHYTHDRRMDALAALEGPARDKALADVREPAYYVLEDYPFWFNGRHIISGKRDRLGLFDASAGTLTPITDADFNCDGFDWEGGLVAFTGSPVSHRNDGYSGVYVHDLAGGGTRCLMEPDVMGGDLLGFWDGKLLLAMTDGKLPVPDGSGMTYEDDQYPDFFLMDPATGERTLLARYEASAGYGTVGSDARLGGGWGAKADGDKFYFLTTVDDSTFLRTIDRDGRVSPPLTPAGSCDSFDVREGSLVYCGLYGGELCELYGGDGRRLTHFSRTEDYTYAPPRMHTFTDRDGYVIHGWAMRPVDWEPGRRYPAILHIHGGPRTVFGDVFHHEMQVWANAGYFVFYCNPRGSDGRGNEFGFISGKYGSIDYEDIMAFLDEMLSQYPEVDPARVGVTGGSYGGFMTNWIIGHTDRFAAAASQRSIANWTTFEYTTDIGLRFAKGQMRATTDTDAEKLWSHSPLRYAKNCHTPTLFIHSDNDFRCWMSEGLAMFTALKKAGVETKLCLFRGENHELSRSGKPKNRISRMNEILAWMDKYCK